MEQHRFGHSQVEIQPPFGDGPAYMKRPSEEQGLAGVCSTGCRVQEQDVLETPAIERFDSCEEHPPEKEEHEVVDEPVYWLRFRSACADPTRAS